MKMLMGTARYLEKRFRLATSLLRVMPDFIIIGAQKGGTTSLYKYLIEHPNIASARKKEVHFFDKNYVKGIDWYRSHFPTALEKFYAENVLKQDFITGEGSPEYLFYPHCAKKVAQLLPHVKIIVMLRNPVERAYSQYRHSLGWGYERKDITFEEVLALEEERTRKGREQAAIDENYHDFSYQRAAYAARGIYIDQMKRWMDLFPREQMLVIRSEDFFNNPAEIYKETLTFLDVPTMIPNSLRNGFKIYNKSKENTPARMNPATRKRLMEFYEPYNVQLYRLIGRDFGWETMGKEQRDGTFEISTAPLSGLTR